MIAPYTILYNALTQTVHEDFSRNVYLWLQYQKLVFYCEEWKLKRLELLGCRELPFGSKNTYEPIAFKTSIMKNGKSLVVLPHTKRQLVCVGDIVS